MGEYLNSSDLTAFEPDIDTTKADAMIADAEALATLAAPCLADLSSLTKVQVAAVCAILRGAVLRWNEAGTGAFQQRSVTTGPFSETESYDTRQQRRNMFWPSEITQLQNICGGRTKSAAFSVDTIDSWAAAHSVICSLFFGGPCSCGAVLSNALPLYEV